MQDNLSTHSAGALYEAFAPAEARRILRRLEFHYTPEHASWLNMVEIEIGVLRGQCLNRKSTTPSASSAKSPHGNDNETPPAPASNGCSQPIKPAPKWAAPIPSRPKSHNHCAEVLAASDKVLVDFGLRRAHRAEAGLMAARASYITGFAGTATVLAGEMFGIPLYGTMARTFIEAFDDEMTAFETLRGRGRTISSCCSTLTTPKPRRGKSWRWRRDLQSAGITIRAVRLDSGNLIALSKSVRGILDCGGLRDVTIFVSGGLERIRLSPSPAPTRRSTASASAPP